MSLSKMKLNLFPNIGKTCKNCNTCCKTYGWLLKKEAEKLIKKGYPIIKLNNNLFCIDSFYKDKKGNRILDKIPRCRFYKKRRCTIQKDKPLDCRLYPLKIKFGDKRAIIGISLGCKYISSMNKQQKERLFNSMKKKIMAIPKKDLLDYIKMMGEINKISKPKKFWMRKLITFSS